MPDLSLRDIEHNRNLVMATDPLMSGPLSVRRKMPRGAPLSGVPKPGDMLYFTHVVVEDGEIVYWFYIPEGAPRTHRMVERNGVKRPVLIGSADDREAGAS